MVHLSCRLVGERDIAPKRSRVELLTKDNDDLMRDLRERYRLGRRLQAKAVTCARWYHPKFPKSRRVLYDRQRPKSPLGWVQITPS